MPNDTPRPETHDAPKHCELIQLTSDVVAAYVSNNATSTADLSGLIETVYSMLRKVGAPVEAEGVHEPAVPLKKSVTKQAILCLECGNAQKILKRHLATAHGLTPEEYRAKWRLAPDYPMTAPDYTEKRRTLATQFGLGRKPAAAPAKSKPKRTTGGKKKSS